MTPRTPGTRLLICAARAAIATTVAAASRPESRVTTAALQALLPAPDGWTKIAESAKPVTISPACEYTFASVTFARDAMRAKVTLADSGAAAECLMTLAPMISVFPDDYVETLGPAVTVARLKIDGLPAAERWDGGKLNGDLEVLVGGRFVVSLEGYGVESLDTLRSILKLVDFKRVADLK